MSLITESDRNKYFKAGIYYKRNTSRGEILFIVFVAISTLLITSKSSPLYPLNDSVDANAFFTIGRAMKAGYIPYRDFYDHKGPYLFFIHLIAALISETSFWGVFLIEVIAAFVYLLYSYRAVCLYFEKNIIGIIPIVSLLTYGMRLFTHGDFVEEFALPLLMIAVYHGLRMLRCGEPLSRRVWVFIGLSSGCILWMKFTILGFYLGWMIVPAFTLIKNKKTKELLHGILFIILGVTVITIPILIYLGINGAIYDWIRVYLIDNLTGYSSFDNTGIVAPVLKNLLTGLGVTLMYSPLIYILLVIGVIWLFISDSKRISIYWVMIFILMHITIYSGGRFYAYYGFDYAIFYLAGLISLLHILIGFSSRVEGILVSRAVGCFVLAVCLSGAYFLSYNTGLIGVKKQDMPQYQIADIIRNDSSGKVSVLTYDTMDIGVYFTCEVIPPCKYFYIPNVSLKESREVQDDLLKKASVDYVAVRGSVVPSENYKEIFRTHGVFEEHDYTYTLYKKAENKA